MNIPAYGVLMLPQMATMRTNHNTTRLAAKAPQPTFSKRVNRLLTSMPSPQKCFLLSQHGDLKNLSRFIGTRTG